MTGPAPDPDHLGRPVRRTKARRDTWERQGERAMGRNLALVGALGWAVVTPTLAGLFIGRWLDAGRGVFWTLSLLTAGLAGGCWTAWTRIRQEEDRG